MILLNNSKIDITHYPNAETALGEQLKDFTTKEEVQNVTLRFETNEDLINLLFIKEWLKEEGFEKIALYMPYLPYSRMDRKVGSHLYTLKYIAAFINQMNFEAVYVLEAHSNKTFELLKNVVGVTYTKELVEEAMQDMKFDKEKDVVVFPDKGAKERYKHLLSTDIEVLQGAKKRDFDTGEILGLTFEETPTKQYRKALIVDDLCSRGGTFIQISALCKEHGINENYLAVTHLESNVYTGQLFEHVEKVFTTDAMQPFLENLNREKIKVIELPVKFNMTTKGGK